MTTIRPERLCAAFLLGTALNGFALDVAGTVRDLSGSALSDVRICILPEREACVRSDSLGGFHIASPTAAFRRYGLPRPDRAGGRMAFHGLDGRYLGLFERESAADLPAGAYVLRPGKGTPPLAKPAFRSGSLEFAKPGYRTATYVPTAPVETGVDIRLAASGDSPDFLLEGGIGSATLAWDPVAGAERYLVRYVREGLPDSQIVEREAASPALVDGLRPGETYRFQVGAVDPGGSGRWSAIKTVRLVYSAGHVGQPGFTPGGATTFVADMDGGDRVWVAFVDTTRTNRITVMRSSSRGWETVGEPGFTPTPQQAPVREGGADYFGLSVAGTADPLLWYREGRNDTLWLWAFEGTGWKLLGPMAGRSVAARTTAAVFVRMADGTLRKRAGARWDSLAYPANCPVSSITLAASNTLYAVCSIDHDPWNSRAVRLDDTGWATISGPYSTKDRDVTVGATIHLAGRDESPYLYIRRSYYRIIRLRQGGDQVLDTNIAEEWLAPPIFTRAGLPVSSRITSGILEYYDGSAPGWRPVPLEGENPVRNGGAITLVDSKDRVYRVYSDPGRGAKLGVSVLLARQPHEEPAP